MSDSRSSPSAPPAPASPPLDPDAILLWARRHGAPARHMEQLAGDVSARRYHRLFLDDGDTVVVAAYPSDMLSACRRFVRTGELLAAAGIRVPAVRAVDCRRGLMLLEDIGTRTLVDLAGEGWSALETRFVHALETAASIASLPAPAVAAINPALDAPRLRAELDQTWKLVLAPGGLTGDAAFAEALAASLDELCRRLGSAVPSPCHRDFMARNLAPVAPAPSLAVLDHQDLRLGPPLYDLASLLNDSLFPPAEVEERLLSRFVAGAEREGYHRAAAQRTLKAVGSYAAFAHRGETRHVPLIGPTLERAFRHLARTAETAPVAARLAELRASARPPIG